MTTESMHGMIVPLQRSKELGSVLLLWGAHTKVPTMAEWLLFQILLLELFRCNPKGLTVLSSIKLKLWTVRLTPLTEQNGTLKGI